MLNVHKSGYWVTLRISFMSLVRAFLYPLSPTACYGRKTDDLVVKRQQYQLASIASELFSLLPKKTTNRRSRVRMKTTCNGTTLYSQSSTALKPIPAYVTCTTEHETRIICTSYTVKPTHQVSFPVVNSFWVQLISMKVIGHQVIGHQGI